MCIIMRYKTVAVFPAYYILPHKGICIIPIAAYLMKSADIITDKYKIFCCLVCIPVDPKSLGKIVIQSIS